MKTKKQSPLVIAIGAILVAVYNIVLFIIAGFEDHTSVFWISYVAMMLAAATAAVSFWNFSKSQVVLKDLFLGFPILRHTFIYIIAEFVLSSLFMILETVVSWELALIVQLILLALHVVIILSCFATKGTVENVSAKVKEKTTAIRMLHADAAMLAEICPDPEAKKEFEELSEMIRYSDPMSSQLLATLEEDIAREIRDAKMNLSCEDIPAALNSCKRAKFLVKERNLKCKALK